MTRYYYDIIQYQFMNKSILNDYLPWNGSHLGCYTDIILKQWTREGSNYCVIILPKGWYASLTDKQLSLGEGILYCTYVCTKNVFPCIVEELKPLFGLAKRGIHRITIDNREYILYYVPITVSGELIWETPLSRLDLRHPVRNDPLFRFEIQKIIAFCDLLSLSNTNESHILIRPGISTIEASTTYVPINSNENATTIVRAPQNNFSIISKVLFTRWFGEETPLDTIIKNMVSYSSKDNLTVITTRLRDQLTNIVTKYDRTMLWYVHFVLGRISKQLLI